VYKPVRGERPLWDFPDGTLADREYAAYLVSEALGWSIVPPTVLRDGPHGRGMCQLWIDEERLDDTDLVGFVPQRDLPHGWHAIAAARDEAGERYVLGHADDPALARIATFDAVINNGDRKGGHIFAVAGGPVCGVDHGVAFSVEGKLRTVLWGWAGTPLPEPHRNALTELSRALEGDLAATLSAHLTAAEVTAVRRRVDRLLSTGRFPQPSTDWPALPWPPM
jgi:uncharacterized repeat protein (TIGR03843 family)